ncbi:phosphatase PAP2 family protein [Streptomyces sp. SL13]|jgi:undecaprenyl-diphosphatase|uniref:Phosphatase PAP2 family protein n=1 Tax=Streptantibioticus silvisoli TaxID=2705255 RepID=A0AA90KFX5_9ACTN|nr:phosphatase PAP2 family protein [Streptantibioticus silvisoli]MDI5967691.1 phosphatase PAP2 family protein [Streptantibioticus silvisoli]MDI5969449.1 phosphatase PAP2 family protein [Streptantibioticus silvisoli]
MNELAFDGSNPDVGLLVRINDLAARSPHWVDRVVTFLGEYGLTAALLGLLVWCWWRVARRTAQDAPAAVAGAAWAGTAAVVAWLLSMPIRDVVQRPGPMDDQDGLYVLLRGTSKFSFVSGHSTLAMAIGVGLFLVHRKAGLLGIGLAVAQGFARVWMGVNYPTDVIGGFALGTATALLLAPLAQLGLVPLARVLDRGRLRVLVRAVSPPTPVAVPADRSATTQPDTGHTGPPSAAHHTCENDLAA